MALEAYYNTGTASVANGSTAVTGQGTAWSSIGIKAGDMFLGKDGRVAIIASVESNTGLTLLADWPGTTQTEAAYAIQPTAPGVELPITVRELIDLLDTHAFFDPDAAGDLASRDAYDDRDAGFSFLDTDTKKIYFKGSATSGDWSGPFNYAQGDKGEAATIEVGTTTTLDPDEDAIVSNAGTSGDAVFNFGIPKGAKGDTGSITAAKGDYAGATAYLPGDVVLDQASSWVALKETTGNAPPSLPATANEWWQLIAQKGADGTGTGDMLAATYDPTSVAGDAFDQDNMVDGTNNKNYTASEKTKLAALDENIASQGEATAGTDNSKRMTALRVAQAIAVLAAGIKNKYDATADPTANDDTGDGYAPGSVWINTTTSEAYRCITAASAAAVWVKTTLTSDELAAVALSGAYDDLTGKPTLGTAAAADTTDFATAAQGAKADSAVQPADIGSMAARDVTISTSDPSGGANGDVWLKYTA